jgi:hypothetical protein
MSSSYRSLFKVFLVSLPDLFTADLGIGNPILDYILVFRSERLVYRFD